MRIALVSTYPPSKGSLNEYAYHFVNYLRHKPEITEIVILADELAQGEYPTIPAEAGKASVTITPSWRFGAWNNAWRIRKALHAVKPDVVLFNMQFATFADKRIPASLGLLAPAFAKATGALTVVLTHNIMETVDLKKAGFGGNPILEWATRTAGNFFTRMLLRADLVALTIPKYVEILTEKYDAQNVFLAPHGAFEETPMPSFDVPMPYQIMTFGKFGTYKRVEILIEAFDILKKRVSYPIELVIAGSDSPNMAGYLDEMKAKYAHIADVRYTGYVAEADVPRIFGDSAVVVFPYNSTTGSSGVLHQAGTYGKATVLPHLGDFAELIAEEGYTGKFYHPDNADELADAIQAFLDSPDERRNCGMQNYMAAVGLPMNDVVDWYLLHFERLMKPQK